MVCRMSLRQNNTAPRHQPGGSRARLRVCQKGFEPVLADHCPILRDLIHGGYTTQNLSDFEVDALRSLYRAGHRFFAQDEEVRERHASTNSNFGYRRMGREYSQSPERPDLNASFTFWGRLRSTIPAGEQQPDLVDALEAYNNVVIRLGSAVLQDVSRYFGRDTPIDFVGSSYLQLNHYRPSVAKRHLLQDPHEDGHLITILHADQPGLEIHIDHAFQPVLPGPSQLIVMPGSILTLMTGGLVAPLVHRVRRAPVPSRMSIMYFVNPSVASDITPFIHNELNANVNIRQRVIKKPREFGLPAIGSFS